MNILSKIVSSSIDSVIDSVGKLIDNAFTSDEERLQLKNQLEQIKAQAKLQQMQLANEQEKEITKRWLSDNEHLITRLVRPISFSAFLILFGSVILADGNIGTFTVKEAYIPLLENVVITMVFAYFGSRGIEKTAKHIKGKGE